ncbi:hypothetical protein BDQ94DRAFT_149682 [Aspergillus welwitschiae]|uniref:Uncharacterized protein n=1 Tax=Aspergillus welwitschiae TaxID=1341132 RepID=A0A3F3PSJ2_9EURO|nr:hypothetical protein BDQ94DRAFT_149682 [Aspergillus welwitschiae]RDH29921.1 hypothetical protein BDQ94DRAFT_149682 [Aspergillus welwitschiae]
MEHHSPNRRPNSALCGTRNASSMVLLACIHIGVSLGFRLWEQFFQEKSHASIMRHNCLKECNSRVTLPSA